MAEQITLTAPVAQPSITTWTIAQVDLLPIEQVVTVSVRGSNGVTIHARYPTPAIDGPLGTPLPSGATLLTQLNKMNFSGANPSFVARVLLRLQTDGFIGAGSVTGTPS